MNDLERAVRAIVGEMTGEPTDDLALDDDLVLHLGIDSLTGLRVLAAIEVKTGVRFPDAKLSSMRTLGEILDVLTQEQRR